MSASGGKADVNEGLIQADARECPLFPKAAAQIRDFRELRAAAFGQNRTFVCIESRQLSSVTAFNWR